MAEALQNKTVVILTGVLLLVIAASIGVLLLLPEENEVTSNTPTASEADLFRDTSVGTGSSSFDLTVTQRQSYQALNKQLVHEGALPVQPPVSTGKANPFL